VLEEATQKLQQETRKRRNEREGNKDREIERERKRERERESKQVRESREQAPPSGTKSSAISISSSEEAKLGSAS
jgi:hypothetical protein